MVDKDHELSVCHFDLTVDGQRLTSCQWPQNRSQNTSEIQFSVAVLWAVIYVDSVLFKRFAVDFGHFIRMQTDTVNDFDLLQTTNEPP